jgi:hypothetical protein
VTQFDKDDVEAAGLVKFDFLGLRTLTIIDRAVKRVNLLRARPASRRSTWRGSRSTTRSPSSCCGPAARPRCSSSSRAA